MITSFIELSGIINIAAGVALLVYWYLFAILLPYRQLSNTLAILVENRNWRPVNALGVLGALLGTLGQAGILVAQLEVAGRVGTIGFFVASTGTILLIGTMLWDTILWPILVKHDARLLDFRGPIYQSKLFMPFFILAGLIYSGGYVLVGIGIMGADVLPSTGGLLLAVGAPAFGLGAMFGKFQVYVRTIGITLMSAGLIWLGASMLS